MKAKIRNTEIYFDVAGMQLAPEGKSFVEKPVLFLIHGGPGGNHLGFKNHSLKLQDYAQLIFIDQRGCGFSKKDKQKNYTLDNNIEDIEALRKHLGLNKICVLGGSYGGMVAQGYAIRYGKNVDKLILMATAPSHKFIDAAKANLEKVGTKKQIAVCEKFIWNGTFKSQRDVKEYFKIMDNLYIYNRRKKFKKISIKTTSLGKIDSTLSFEVLNAGFRNSVKKFNFVPHLKKIKCPTLILAGKYDWVCMPEQSKLMAEKIPNSILKVFNNCGHAVATEMGDKYIKAVTNFLKK